MAFTIATMFAEKNFIVHGNGGTFEFLNDTGVTLEQGQSIFINDGTDDHECIVTNTTETGRVCSATLLSPKIIIQAPFGGGANVAVGELLSLEGASGNLLKNTTGTGRYVALPKPGKTMTGASAAAATADTSIYCFAK